MLGDLQAREGGREEASVNEGKMAMGFLVAFVVMVLALAFAITTPGEGWERQGGVLVWTDAKTGCRYTQGDQGMSPLLGPDGKPDCARRQ